MADRAKLVVPEKYTNRVRYSISKLGSFKNCQHGYYLTYIKKLKGKGNIYSTIGEKVHEILEFMQRREITNGQGLEMFGEKLLECDMMEMKFPSDKIKENYVACVKHYLKNYSPVECAKFIQEKEYWTEIGELCSVLMGYIDLIVLNEDKTIDIIDYKTSSEYKGKDIHEHATQLILYAMAIEKEFNVKVNRIGWNMLKYAYFSYNKRLKKGISRKTTWVARHQLVKSVLHIITADMRELGYDEMDIDMYSNKALAENDINILPDNVKENYLVEDGYVWYDYDDTARSMLVSYIDGVVGEIEAKDPLIEAEWAGKTITEKESFFCNVLCDQRIHCKYFKAYMDSREENGSNQASEPEQKKTSILNDIFS